MPGLSTHGTLDLDVSGLCCLHLRPTGEGMARDDMDGRFTRHPGNGVGIRLANTKSAKKRIRVTLRRTLENRRRKTFVRTAIRRFERVLAAGDHSAALEALKVVYRALDRAAQKGAIHRNRAARKKSRLARRLSRLAG